MTFKLGYNTTDSAVLVDHAGYQLGGRSWGPIDSADDICQAELAAGRVVVVEDEAGAAASDNELVAAGYAALVERRRRHDEAVALSKAELLAAVDPDVVDDLPTGGDGLPAKADLVAAVEDGADLTTTTTADPAATTTSRKKTTTSRTAAN